MKARFLKIGFVLLFLFSVFYEVKASDCYRYHTRREISVKVENGKVFLVNIIKDPNGRINILRNKTNSPVWEGPLVIMQNEFSASASEILAGAMKDYGRAVVVGSPHSYGKGTVQTFADLNRFMNSTDDFGSIKLTIQKFYRFN